MTSQRENEEKQAEDVLFDMFKNEDTGLLPVGKFLAVSKCINRIQHTFKQKIFN